MLLFPKLNHVYDGLRLRFSICTHNRLLDLRYGVTCDTPLESLCDRLTPENDITASSEFGINGTVGTIQ
ncbi:hypothetical protein [Nostoc sp.]|uniref:hypothetical protein n=1 Tax=Nostoc sp. TaxID=1180 RepID=UPI002FFD389E